MAFEIENLDGEDMELSIILKGDSAYVFLLKN